MSEEKRRLMDLGGPRCPECNLPLYVHKPTSKAACKDINCKYGHGGLNAYRVEGGWDVYRATSTPPAPHQ